MAFDGSCATASADEDEEVIRKGISDYESDIYSEILDSVTELSDVPMEELQRIRLKIGTKKFDSALKCSLAERKKKNFTRANKNRSVFLNQIGIGSHKLQVQLTILYPHRPSEISSKKWVSQFKEVVHVQKKKEENHDPRFDERAGKLNSDLFKKSYSFIEEIKKNERHLVLKEEKKTKDPEKKMKLQRLIQKMVR